MMKEKSNLTATLATDVPLRRKMSIYPEPFATRMAGREKRQLGEFFGLENFGVNLTTLEANAMSALRHSHSKQDELIYVLSGHPTLYTDDGPVSLAPGMCVGMRAGTGKGYNLVNETSEVVSYLEIGDRTPGDEVVYPDDDLMASEVDGRWKFFHKDGTPY